MNTFTDSNGYEWLMAYGICDCYVWYTPWEMGGYGGRCGRCNGGVKLLNPSILSKEEAREIYYDEHRRYPKPMGL